MNSERIFHCIYKVLYVFRSETADTDATALYKVDMVLADQVLDLWHCAEIEVYVESLTQHTHTHTHTQHTHTHYL